jgi:tetratricopeptide (TPR) repeat protein
MKKYKMGRNFAFLLFVGLTFQSMAQQSLQNAFTKSYELEQSEDYQQAADTLKKVCGNDSYECNLRLGWLSYKAGDYTGALRYYQACIDLKPLSIEARQGYALPASTLGHWDGVLGKYQEILHIDPNHSLTNYRTGSIYYSRKDYKSAEKHFEKVVNLYPFDYDSLLMLGWTKYFLGKHSEAKVLFNKVLLYAPGDESATEGLGLLK